MELEFQPRRVPAADLEEKLPPVFEELRGYLSGRDAAQLAELAHHVRLVGEPDGKGGKSIYVAAGDVDALFKRMKKAGATIVEEPADRHYGNREFICRDPEGNVWSFGTYWPKAYENPD